MLAVYHWDHFTREEGARRCVGCLHWDHFTREQGAGRCVGCLALGSLH